MPSAISSRALSPIQTDITKFTNCRVFRDGALRKEDLWISSRTGKVLHGQDVFYSDKVIPDNVIDLGERILSPGLIEAQLNGAFGFDFSVVPENISQYPKELLRINRRLIKTGVTSYTPTTTCSRPEVYHKILPYLGPSGSHRIASNGSESLGAHVEGPFISKAHNGIHSQSVIQTPKNGFSDLVKCYGAINLEQGTTPIRYLTIAPELPGALSVIRELKTRGITVSIGHSDANYEEARLAMDAGATMVTHCFNAMLPLHHRNPGIFGLIGQAHPPDTPKPYFGVISDGVHLHPSVVNIAWHAHPEGFILVTDAVYLIGLPDGVYDGTNGERIVKTGPRIVLEGTDTIAGSNSTLIECVNNFLGFSGATVAQALGAVTSTPAKMLGVDDVKGSLEPGADADLVVLEEIDSGTGRRLKVEQVWKFGECVYDSVKEQESSSD